MPVRPKGRPTGEGLSYNGETAESERQSAIGDAVGQRDGCAPPGAASPMEEESDGRGSADGD